MLRLEPLVLPLVLSLALAACAGTAPRGADRATQARQAAELQVKLGQEYMQQGNLRVAMERLQRALELDPRYTNAHTVIAVLYERIEDHERAGFHYRRAAALSPDDGRVLNNLGTYLCSRGQFEESEQHFLKAIRDPFYPTPDVALTNAGLCARLAGNSERAEEFMRAALDRRPENDIALFELASLLHERGEHFRARAFLQRYEAVVDSSAAGLALGASIERALGNIREAEAYESRLLARHPDSPQARQLRDPFLP